MKIILTGATGFIGGSVLRHLVASPEVDSVVVLSRRELPASPSSADPKVKVLIVKDFLKYGPDVLEQIAEAGACLWCLGAPTSGADVHIDYPGAFTTELLNILQAREEKVAAASTEGTATPATPPKPFRFVSCSGALIVRDQNASLWFLDKLRKARGKLENSLIEIEEANPSLFRANIVRPAMVLGGRVSSIAPRVLPLWIARPHTIDVEVVGKAFARVAIEGDARQTLENADLVELGSQ